MLNVENNPFMLNIVMLIIVMLIIVMLNIVICCVATRTPLEKDPALPYYIRLGWKTLSRINTKA